MIDGFRNGFLRLKNGTGHLAATLIGSGHVATRTDEEALAEHDLRDLGLLDGRVSPSTVRRDVRPDAWDILERSPRWL